MGQVTLKTIGHLRTDAVRVPKHWTDSDAVGTIVIDAEFAEGLTGITPGDTITVIFLFHRSDPFTRDLLKQHPRGDHTRPKRGVFALCSPRRPNPIGLSVVTVLSVTGREIAVRGIDMIDGTPILDIKPAFTVG